jgi:phospho-N-acetylmuramoyl-pentapeptide-transferase
MGGFIILFASIAATVLWAAFNDMVVVTLIVYLFCTLMGAMDDALKIIRENSTGLTAWQKLFLHGLITAFVWYVASKNPPVNNLLTHVDWRWLVGQFDSSTVALLTFAFLFLVIAGTSNAVNITDGIDGLAISSTMQCLFFFGVVAFFSRDFSVAKKSLLTYISGSGELAVLCACFTGGSVAFFAFNMSPASIFMGDMGAIGLGGLLAIVAILLRQPFALVLVGSIFVVETVSVALQVTSKRLFKRKIFLMAPLHHHFELKGHSERAIIRVAFILQTICTVVAFCIVFYGCLRFH